MPGGMDSGGRAPDANGDEFLRIVQVTDSYSVALDDWKALIGRVRRGEQIQTGELKSKLDALNLAHARLAGLIF